MEKFEIGFSGGAAIPLGNFKSVNIENLLNRNSIDQGSILFRPLEFAGNPVPSRLNALVYGLDLKASYTLFKKINGFTSFSYLQSDHPHEYWTLARGASYGYFIEDRIDFRVILANFGVSFDL